MEVVLGGAVLGGAVLNIGRGGIEGDCTLFQFNLYDLFFVFAKAFALNSLC